MIQIEFNKTVNNIAKLNNELKADNIKYDSLTVRGDSLYVNYTSALSQAEVDSASSIVNNFVEISVKDQTKGYLLADVDEFITDLEADFAAENMLLGITQAGKTGAILGIMSERITLAGETRAFSLLDTFRTKSLFESIRIIDYLVANMATYEEAPFVTADRLNGFKTKILEFLS